MNIDAPFFCNINWLVLNWQDGFWIGGVVFVAINEGFRWMLRRLIDRANDSIWASAFGPHE